MAKKTRRMIALGVIVLGCVLLVFAPETKSGLVLIGMGVLIEFLGFYLEHHA